MSSSVRAWLFFILLASIPAAFVGALVARASMAERDRVRADQKDERLAILEATRREFSTTWSKTEETLRALPPASLQALANQEGATEELAELLRATQPRFADVVVAGRGGELAVPPGPVRDLPSSPACPSAIEALFGEGRDAARALIIADCMDARGRGGRFLWPLLALEAGAFDQVPSWLEGRAERLGAAERDVIRKRIAALPPPGRERATAALDRGISDREAIVAVLAEPSVDDVTAGEVRSHHGRGLSLLRTGAGGAYAGYVVHDRSLARLAVPSHLALAVAATAGENQVRLGPELFLGLAPRDAALAEAEARRAGDRLAWIGAAGITLCLGLAAWVFRRAQRAQQLADLRTDFVAAVSHELRTPAASVRMFAELLEAGSVDGSERQEVERTLAEQSRRLANTLERMLRFGALSRGKLAVETRRVALTPIATEAVARLQAVTPTARVDVDVDASLEAEVDPGLLGLLLDNLLANALKYASDGGPYGVSIHREASDVVLRVSDHGPGIAPNAHSRIFLPFERADDRLSRATDGTGIGLALVRGIAGAHGGKVAVESVIGEGTTFVVRFPIKSKG